MFTVGLTGGIGSGKSEVSRRFEALGITVADADLIARSVVEPNQPALDKISQHFGEDILLPNGGLDRAKLRQIIFGDSRQKLWLEQLLHPLIAAEIDDQLNNAASPYSILSSPLLLESQQWQRVDRVLVVDTPVATQVKRSCARDSNSEAQIHAIINSQIKRQDRLQRADDIVDNHGNIDALQPQVELLHRQYLVACAAGAN